MTNGTILVEKTSMRLTLWFLVKKTDMRLTVWFAINSVIFDQNDQHVTMGVI